MCSCMAAPVVALLTWTRSLTDHGVVTGISMEATALGTLAPTTLVCAVAGGLKPQVPSLPNPASPEVKQAASQAVDAVKVGTSTEFPTRRLQQAVGVGPE